MTGQLWKHKAEVAWMGDDSRAVILDLDHLERMPLVLEGTAANIWCLLKEPRSVDDASALLAERYAEDPTDLRVPVAEFIEQLAALEVIRSD